MTGFFFGGLAKSYFRIRRHLLGVWGRVAGLSCPA